MLTPKNWKSFQHYKERTPSWIKLHKGLLTDFTFNRLPLASRALAPMLWLLASEYEDGAITASQEEIAFRLHVSEKDLTEALKPLVDSGFFIASKTLSECTQEAIPEKRDIEQDIDKRERKETREVALSFDPVEFHVFWEDWPNKVGKPAAVKALAAARKRGALFGEIMDGVRSYIRDKPPDRPWLNPATFLNQNRWEDQPATVTHGNRNPNQRPTGHDAILAAAARKACNIDAQYKMAGSGDEISSAGGNGDVQRGPGPSDDLTRSKKASFGRNVSDAGAVFEGEIIAPDKVVAGLG